MIEILVIAFIALILYYVTLNYPSFADFLIIVLLTFNLYFLLKSNNLINVLKTVKVSR
jgi:hypothetical protein